MEKQILGRSDLEVSRLGVGCMRFTSEAVAVNVLRCALKQQINFFDHADIYGAGMAEHYFAQACKALGVQRQNIILQSKCGIRPDNKTYDFSCEHITASVEGSLQRLQTDYLDILVLHRPDVLADFEAVAKTLEKLKQAGKVRYFGVSNYNSMQIELLQKYLGEPLIVNQLQFSVKHTGIIDSGIYVNTLDSRACSHDGYVLDYCQLKDISVQAWSPFMYGMFEGVFLDNERFPELNAYLDILAKEYNTSNSAIAIAWILRHPAKIQPIIGATNVERLATIYQATNIKLTREQWYAIYRVAGNILP